MNIHIYMPRLDIPFKKSVIPATRSRISDLRLHWLKFVKTLAKVYSDQNHKVTVIEAPLFNITVEKVRQNSYEADLIYIPHKMQENWLLDSRVRYYMQMVIPHIFSIDSKGWCASTSFYPIPLSQDIDADLVERLKLRKIRNESKFQQNTKPDISLANNTGFLFFPCQLPHDETIRYHSDVSVLQALESLLVYVRYRSETLSLVVKGHPANPESMKPLKETFDRYAKDASSDRLIWADSGNIHKYLERSSAVFTVNSGVGFEALLHSKQVYNFGYCDYQNASTKITYGGSLENAVRSIEYSLRLNCNIDPGSLQLKCDQMIHSWYHSYYDYSNIQTFNKLLH